MAQQRNYFFLYLQKEHRKINELFGPYLFIGKQ
ncbi:MAG: hypothetical protein RL259_1680 [Bacteroidota bacterium]|jgi:hypothetical protein